MTSALSLRISTAARRTVQTLIGSNVALRTSTRPFVAPSTGACPRRRCSSSDADPGGAGGTSESMAGVSVEQCNGRATPAGTLMTGASRGRIRPQHAQLLGLAAHRFDRARHRSVGVPALEVGEEHVVTQTGLARPRLDQRQIDAAKRKLRQTAHEPARGVVAGAPEDDRRLPGSASAGVRAVAGQPDEPRLVVRQILDASLQDLAAV